MVVSSILLVEVSILGGSDRVVNSLDFCPASLKSLGCFYFHCILSSQWKAVAVNLRVLHCQLSRHFWRPIVRMCLATNSNLLLLLCASKHIFSTNSWSLVSQKMMQRHFFPTIRPLSPVFFAIGTMVAFLLLHNSRFKFHCYTQHEATSTQKLAWKWRSDLSWLIARKITKSIHSCKPASLGWGGGGGHKQSIRYLCWLLFFYFLERLLKKKPQKASEQKSQLIERGCMVCVCSRQGRDLIGCTALLVQL